MVSRRATPQKSTPNRPEFVHQFLIVLGGTDPLVWRRIQVPLTYPLSRRARIHDALPERAGARPRTVAACTAMWISLPRSPIQHTPSTRHRSLGSAARTIRTASIRRRSCSTIHSNAGKRPSRGNLRESATGKKPMERHQEASGTVRPHRSIEPDRGSVQRHRGESSIPRVPSARRRRRHPDPFGCRWIGRYRRAQSEGDRTVDRSRCVFTLGSRDRPAA